MKRIPKFNLTRREALTSVTTALTAGLIASKSTAARAQNNDLHKGHDMHKGHNMDPKPPLEAKPAPINNSKWQVPKGNSFYARSVDPNGSYNLGLPDKDYTPVIVPDGKTLPFKIKNGVKIFHLIAEELTHEFAPGLKAHCWGYNGSVHGPLIEAVEGDRIRIYVTNKLKTGTTVHWHGLVLPMGMDGVSGLTQPPIQPGETYKYEWTLTQHGTFMYHSHKDGMVQKGMGLMGMMIVHPRQLKESRPDRDFALLLSEWDIKPGTFRPDINVPVGFNTLTINARAFPGTQALVVKTNQKTRIRFCNLSAMSHHPIHLHGHAFEITETDGGVIPKAARWPETTVLVATGQTRTIEFMADNPGDWAMHCHMSHHTMNQMGHDIPNMLGVQAAAINKEVAALIPEYMTMGTEGMADMGRHAQHMARPANAIPMVGTDGKYDYIAMGGMFTVLKVRNQLTSYSDPGWYSPPKNTSTMKATMAELKEDGISTS